MAQRTVPTDPHFTAHCPLTIRRRIRSFSMRSCSFFCSRSVLAWCIIMALFNLPILPWMLRWNSLNSLACCSTLFRYSWCTQNVHHTLISKATQLHFTLEHVISQSWPKNRWLSLCWLNPQPTSHISLLVWCSQKYCFVCWYAFICVFFKPSTCNKFNEHMQTATATKTWKKEQPWTDTKVTNRDTQKHGQTQRWQTWIHRHRHTQGQTQRWHTHGYTETWTDTKVTKTWKHRHGQTQRWHRHGYTIICIKVTYTYGYTETWTDTKVTQTWTDTNMETDIQPHRQGCRHGY